MTHESAIIIKRHDKREVFNRNKLYESIIKACLAVRTSEGSAVTAANAVCEVVTTWLHERPEVTSDDIKRVAAQALTNHNPEAAYFYTHHKHIV